MLAVYQIPCLPSEQLGSSSDTLRISTDDRAVDLAEVTLVVSR